MSKRHASFPACTCTGVTGVGKSVISAAALEGIRSRKGALPVTFSFSAQTSSADTQALIEGKLEKKRKTRCASSRAVHAAS
jgi:dynein heavy chain